MLMPAWIWAILLFFSMLFAAKLIYVVCTGWSMPVTRGALFVPTHRIRIDAVLDAVPMQPGDLFLDLGCGDGRVLRAVRKRYGVGARGIDVNPLACLAARLRNLGDRRVWIQRSDFWEHHTGGADVVFCYLFPDVMDRMARKLEEELAPGTRVVSCNFPLPGWRPSAELHPDSFDHGDPIFLYRSGPPAPERPGSGDPAGTTGPKSKCEGDLERRSGGCYVVRSKLQATEGRRQNPCTRQARACS